jgi:hypothetical protein
VSGPALRRGVGGQFAGFASKSSRPARASRRSTLAEALPPSKFGTLYRFSLMLDRPGPLSLSTSALASSSSRGLKSSGDVAGLSCPPSGEGVEPPAQPVEPDLVRGCDLAVEDVQDERRDLIFSQCDD